MMYREINCQRQLGELISPCSLQFAVCLAIRKHHATKHQRLVASLHHKVAIRSPCTYVATAQRRPQEFHDVVALDATAPEAFGPCDQPGLGNAILAARKAKREAHRQFRVLQVASLHERCQTFRDVIEQL